MGGRVSRPVAADGLSEKARSSSARYRRINGRTLTAPLAAITMAGLLFVYARTSIHAARLNAQKHRESDGGQLDWGRESRRRHGQLDRVDERALLKEAVLGNTTTASKEIAKTAVASRTGSAKALEEFKKERKLERFDE